MDFFDVKGDEGLIERLHDRESIFDGHILHVERWGATLPDGGEAGREIVRHPGAAAAVAVDDRGRVLLVRQFRAPLGEAIWEIPAGKLDARGEDTLECAKRELEEEAGCTADNWVKLTDLVTTPGFCDEHIGIYLATGLRETHAHLDDDEFLNVARVPFSEALAAVTSGALRDAKTICGLLLANTHLNAQEDM